MNKRLILFIHYFLVIFSFLFLTSQTFGLNLINKLGSGNNPHLLIVLSTNGPSWKPYSIDYNQSGGLPYSSDPSLNWSTWNVKDSDGTYYGTITLSSDGTYANFVKYAPGTKSLNNVQLTQIGNDYQLSTGIGPFPNTPLATPAVYPNSTTPIVLSVSGNKIINNQNKNVILKGLVRPSLEWNPQGQFLSPSDIQNMKKWGANVIRLDLNQQYWFASGPVTQEGSYKQIINAMVYYAIKNDMAVIFDLHWTVTNSQSPMANQDSIRFWKEVATDYQQFGTVIFELFNEPYGIDQNTWLNGNASYAGYQQLYNAVRSTGSKNLCIINGLDYGYNLSFVNQQFMLNGTNIIYGSHPYNEKANIDYPGPGGNFENNFKGVIGSYPIIFTEFGVNGWNYFPNGYQAVYNRILAYANQQGIHYTGFAWWVDSPVFPALISDWNGTPSNGGVMIHNDLQTNPGFIH